MILKRFLKNPVLCVRIIKLALKKIILLLIKFYQVCISPFLGKNCRFYPTCSAYTYEAIEIHGIIKGVYLGVKRILKCHPYNKGGYDPVPPKKTNKKITEEERKERE